MKKVLASVLVVVTVLLCTMSDAWAERWNKQQHGDWISEITTLVSGDAAPVMYTWDKNMGRQTYLEIMFLKNGEYRIRVVILSIVPSLLDYAYDPSGEISIGNKKMGKYSFSLSIPEADVMNLKFAGNETSMIQEFLKTRPSDIIKIWMVGLRGPLEYSLSGFSSALERCEVLKKYYK